MDRYYCLENLKLSVQECKICGKNKEDGRLWQNYSMLKLPAHTKQLVSQALIGTYRFGRKFIAPISKTRKARHVGQGGLAMDM